MSLARVVRALIMAQDKHGLDEEDPSPCQSQFSASSFRISHMMIE